MQIRALWRRAQALAIGVCALLALPAVAMAQPALLDNLREYSTQRMQIEAGPGETLALRVDLGGEPVDITLAPHSVRSERTFNPLFGPSMPRPPQKPQPGKPAPRKKKPMGRGTPI